MAFAGKFLVFGITAAFADDRGIVVVGVVAINDSVLTLDASIVVAGIRMRNASVTNSR